MAFFVSESSKTIVCRPTRTIHDPDTGRRLRVERGLYVKFRRREAPLWAREVAIEAFPMKARPHWYPKGEWVGWIDTDNEQEAFSWSEEEKRQVEQVLRERSEVIEVHQPVPEPPWATYDSLSVKQNLDLAARTGTSIEELLAYERATRNDEKVVAEYEAALGAIQEIEQVVSA